MATISGGGTLYQTCIDSDNVYAVTSAGLFIYDASTEVMYAYATSSGYFNSVWSDDNYVFIGTVSNGIQVLDKDDISSGEIMSYLGDYARAPFLNSDNVIYLHGNSDKLICCTDVGVDIVRRDSSYITNATVSGANKCFVTPSYDYYYYTAQNPTTSGWTLSRLDGNTNNWAIADATYSTGETFLSSATSINDIFVTEYTSISGDYNTLFLATDRGVYVYDEGSTDYYLLTTVS